MSREPVILRQEITPVNSMKRVLERIGALEYYGQYGNLSEQTTMAGLERSDPCAVFRRAG